MSACVMVRLRLLNLMGFACNLSFTVFSFKFGFGWENVAGVLVSNEILRVVDKGEKSAFRFDEIFGFDDFFEDSIACPNSSCFLHLP